MFKWFRNLNIGWKYGLIITIIFLLFTASTIFVSSLIIGIGNNVDELDQRGDRSTAIMEMGSLTRGKAIRVVGYLRGKDQTLIDEYHERDERFQALQNDVQDNMRTEEQTALFEQIVLNNVELNDLFLNEVVPAVNSGQTIAAQTAVDEANELQLNNVALLDELTETVNEERRLAVAEAKESQQLTLIVQIGAMAASIIVGVLLVVFVSRTVSRNLNQVVEVSHHIAEGNLAVQDIDYQGNDEIGRLAAAVNMMSAGLRTVVKHISEVSETVTSQSEELTQSANEVKAGSEQIASTMQELASGSETQAATSNDLAGTMKVFAQKVEEANERGEQIEKTSAGVLDMTNRGIELMNASTDQMSMIDQMVHHAVQKVEGLDQHSQKISELVSVIKDIAEQTNLLALNAAIEAARAGEHGQGFAVVADEVRKLAEQSSHSVMNITDIVTSIQNESSMVVTSLRDGYKEVEQGTEHIRTTGQTFSEISTAVIDMVDHIKTISANLSDIAANSQEVNGSIQEIAAISEESAAGIEQTSASSEQSSSAMEEIAASSNELAKLAEDLNGLVHRFKF